MANTSKQRTRKHELHITLTEEEYQKLNEWAEQAHMSRTAYARSVLFRKRPTIIHRTPMDEAMALELEDKFSAISTKLSEQEIALRESDMTTETLEAMFSKVFEMIHAVCVRLEQWMGV